MNIGIEFDVFKDIIESKIDKQNIIKKLFLNPNKDLSSQVIEQLKNEGNNIYIIINENNYEFIKQNREKYKIIIKKFLNKSDIKYDDIIFVNQYDREFIYENRVEMVLTSNINTAPFTSSNIRPLNVFFIVDAAKPHIALLPSLLPINH